LPTTTVYAGRDEYTGGDGAFLGDYADAVQGNYVYEGPMDFTSPEEYRDYDGNPLQSGSGFSVTEQLRNVLSGSGFQSTPTSTGETAPRYGSDVPQVDTSGNVIRSFEPRESYNLAEQFGQGTISALDSTAGAILPTVAQMVSILGLGTYDQVRELAASLVGAEYQANPDAVREISHKIAEAISQPFGKAADVIASQFTGKPDSVTNTFGYENEASGRALRFADEKLNEGAKSLSEATGLPEGYVRFMMDTAMLRPGTTAGLVKEAGTAAMDVGRGYVDAATGIVSESPTGARSLGETIADVTKSPLDTSLWRGDSTIKRVDTGEVVNDGGSTFVSPEKLTGPTRALEYTSPDAVASLDSVTPSRNIANIFDESFAEIDRTPTFETSPISRIDPAKVETQLAPETQGALPTTLAEPAVKTVNLGPNVDSNSVAKISTEAASLDRNLRNLDDPQVQRQAKEFISNVYEAKTKEPIPQETAEIFNGMFWGGATSAEVADVITNATDNPAAAPDVIVSQAQQSLNDYEEFQPLTDTEKAQGLSNIIKISGALEITPEVAIKTGLVNKDGSKTELGESVINSTKPSNSVETSTKPLPETKPPVTITDDGSAPPTTYPPVDGGTPPDDGGTPPVNGVIFPPVNEVIYPPVDQGVFPPFDEETYPPLISQSRAMTPKLPQLSAPASGGLAGRVFNPNNPGALPGYLEGTFLEGVDVEAYDPFESYNLTRNMQPITAAQGGSPLQLMQLQQGIVGGDPSEYSNIQYRPTPNYFTYGSKPEQPTSFAGSQLMGKPRPNIPVTPTGNIGATDWLYGAAGNNQLSPAGAALPALPSGMMANGGQAQGGGEGEHIPEFITGATGHYVRGRGDGQSDDIPAMLADGEYVFDSSAVSTLGNGSSDAGAKLLDAFRETLREHTRSAPKDKIPPKASPLQYMQEAMKKVGMA
jgi:hypothetical protein